MLLKMWISSTDIDALQHPSSRRLTCLQCLRNYIGQVQHEQASAHTYDGCLVLSVCTCVYVSVFVDKYAALLMVYLMNLSREALD